MTRAEHRHAVAVALAGGPVQLVVATPDLSTYRTQSGCVVHVWDGGDAILLPPRSTRGGV